MSAHRRLRENTPGSAEFNGAWADMEEALYPAVALPVYCASRSEPGCIVFEGTQAWIPFQNKRSTLGTTQHYVMCVVVGQTSNDVWIVQKDRYGQHGRIVPAHPDVVKELADR